jgi:hypothetical protein
VWGFRSSNVKVHAVPDAATDPAGGPYPVLVFSPSANPPLFYAALLEELASHGYVVVGISHTYETIPFSVLPDGGLRVMNGRSLGGAFGMPGKRPFEEDLRERAGVVEVKALDIRFAIGELARLAEEPGILAARLDLERLGVLGHSFGGGAAVEVCRLDGRVRAGASVDGGLWRRPEHLEVSQPVLQLFGEHPEYRMPCSEALDKRYYTTPEYCEEDRATTVGAWQALHERARPGHSLLVRGAGHASFLDWPLLPLWRISLARRGLGSLAPGEAWRTASDYLLAFFASYLRGEPAAVLDRAETDPRVKASSPAELFGPPTGTTGPGALP